MTIFGLVLKEHCVCAKTKQSSLTTLGKIHYIQQTMNPPSRTKETLALLHSMMVSVIFSFFLEPNIVGGHFQMSFWKSLPGIITALVFFSLCIVFFSGMYGAMVEIASGEKDLLTIRQIWTNAKEYWWVYALLAMIPIAFHVALFKFLPHIDIPILFVGILFDIIILYSFAQIAIRKKYLRPMKISKQTSTLTFKSAALICGIVVVSLAVGYLSSSISLFPYGFGRLKSILFNSCFFGLKYAHFFLFLYFCMIIFECHPEIKKRLSSKKEVILVTQPAEGIFFSLTSMLLRLSTPVFVLLRAMTPPRYNVKVFNQAIWHDRYYGPNKLVGITSFTSNVAEAYRIAKKFREHGSKVVMGGAHVMFLPEEASEFCDSVVIGDAEPVWHQILDDFENNCLKKIYVGAQTPAYHEASHQEILKLDPVLISHYIETGRGCKFHCDFCTIPAICGRTIRHKPLPEVMELLEKIKGHVPAFSFRDNNLYANPHYAKELFRAIKPLNMKWCCSCSIDIARDDEALRLAKESGCIMMLIGYEISADSQETEKAGKYSMAKDYLMLTRKIKKIGIDVKAHFIFGFDGDSFSTLKHLWKFCARLFPTFTIITLLTPLPGSKFFKDVLRENRMLNLNWSRYTLTHLAFQPKNINVHVYNALYPMIYLAFLATSSQGLALLALLFFIWKKVIVDGGRLLLSSTRL